MTTTDNRQPTIDHRPQMLVADQTAPHLPFDQYGRYRMVQEALDATRPILGERLRVLDVGGFFRTGRGVDMLPIMLFLPNDDVTVIDQQPGDLPGYIQGDGRSLTFDDATFDFVVSCDTLEHVPAPDRPAFWRELLRVARYGIILAAPFASPEVVAAEDLLSAYIRAELGTEQPQLAEHRAYGLPDLAQTSGLLDSLGLRYHVYPSGYLYAWLVMMIVKHTRQLGNLDLQEQFDTFYTQCFACTERREPAYRHVWVVERDNQGNWLMAVDAALQPTIDTATPAGTPGWAALAGWLPHLLHAQREERHTRLTATQAQTILELQQALAERDNRLRDLEQRARWLEDQATEARRALHAVEQGRMLRLLNWAKRRLR